jgi:hypothetical protein
MKDIYEVIRQKEADLERVQREIEALRLSARLLEDNVRPAPAAPVYAATQPKPQAPNATPAPAAWATAKQFP